MEREITGVMIYYYEVCKRKLWYFYNEIQMEQGNENVLIGRAIDEETYKRDKKHINIDNLILSLVENNIACINKTLTFNDK